MSAVTWLGHSSLVIDVDGVRFVTDPVLSRRVVHLSRDRGVPRSSLGRLDAVLVSHVHLDHLDLPSLRRIERSVPVVLPLRAGGIVRRCGFEHVHEVSPGDKLAFGEVSVEAVSAAHGAVRRYVRGGTRALGYVMRGSRSVYFAGDTDLFEEMRELAPLDVALLPVSGWGPRLPPGHLDPRRAAEALLLLRPAVAVPIHWGTYRTPFAAPEDGRAPDAFRRAAGELAPEVEVRVLRVGETLVL